MVVNKNIKPIERQMTEAVRIAKKEDGKSLNSKNEFNHHSIGRLRIGSLNCHTCGKSLNTRNELNEHVEKFHRKFTGEICQEKIFGKYSKREHMKNIHNLQ